MANTFCCPTSTDQALAANLFLAPNRKNSDDGRTFRVEVIVRITELAFARALSR
jgi:hypothetical protein